MTDIVDRLRVAGNEWYECCGDIHLLLNEAADHIERDCRERGEGNKLLVAAIDQNDAMRQELANVGNLVSDLARTMRVDQANADGTWPDLAGRVRRLIEAAPRTEADGAVREALQPFAREAERWDGVRDEACVLYYIDTEDEVPFVTVGDFRRARSTLAALAQPVPQAAGASEVERLREAVRDAIWSLEKAGVSRNYPGGILERLDAALAAQAPGEVG